jgi:phosphoglycolate phosphatase-like HAD superfamily hydrolase
MGAKNTTGSKGRCFLLSSYRPARFVPNLLELLIVINLAPLFRIFDSPPRTFFVHSFGITSQPFCPTYFASVRDLRTASKLMDSTLGSDKVEHGLAEHRIKGIIFDIDGTLVDSWKLGYDATVQVLSNYAASSSVTVREVTPQIYHACTRFATPERLARHVIANHDPDVKLDDPDLVELGKRLGEKFDDLYISLVSIHTASFFSGIRQMLQSLPEHIRLGALTNAAARYAEKVLHVNAEADGDTGGLISSWHARFSSVRGADNVPRAKPAPDGLIVVCNDLNLRPSECIYVGDSPTDGMAARAADMKCIGVSWGSHSQESLLQSSCFDYLCASPEDLHALIANLTDL